MDTSNCNCKLQQQKQKRRLSNEEEEKRGARDKTIGDVDGGGADARPNLEKRRVSEREQSREQTMTVVVVTPKSEKR